MRHQTLEIVATELLQAALPEHPGGQSVGVEIVRAQSAAGVSANEFLELGGQCRAFVLEVQNG